MSAPRKKRHSALHQSILLCALCAAGSQIVSAEDASKELLTDDTSGLLAEVTDGVAVQADTPPATLNVQPLNFQALNWYPRSLLSEEESAALPSFCSGMYRPYEITPLEGDRIEAEADESEMQIDGGDITLSGNVLLKQKDRVLLSDRVRWLADTGEAELSGNIRLRNAGLAVNGDRAHFNEATGEVEVYDANYSLTAKHLRGSATMLQRPDDNLLLLDDATMTFCEPDQNDWDIMASEIRLDQASGFGTAWHSRLRIKEVPVLYFPYYRFPIDDRRLSGFLDPKIAINGEGQAEDIQLPLYLNLHPQMDATITPHHVLDHGVIWENQLRHKTRLLGDGELNYNYLNHDAELDDERWLTNYQQSGRWGEHWQHDWVYNHVSDNDYFSDLNPTGTVDRTSHLPRYGRVRYADTHLRGTLLAESFQTIDENITLRNRPYRRLPQTNVIWQPLIPDTENLWNVSQTVEFTRFNRESSAIIGEDEQTLNGFRALNGDRVLADTALSYNMRWPFGFLIPKAEYRYRGYRLYDEDVADIDENPEFDTYRLSLDGTLIFEREFEALNREYQQTLEPRLFYVYSPYEEGQEDVPAFDTKDQTVTFNSLFTGDRFTGGDRLADLNQLGAGVTTRFFRDDGLEQLRFSIGRIWYFADRQVTLEGRETEEMLARETSSTLGEAEWNPNSYLSVFSFLEWDPYDDYARQRQYGVRYADKANHMLSISRSEKLTRDIETDRETFTDQLDIGVFWALTDSWALFGRQLRDLEHYENDVRQPEDPTLEALAGVEYQNCCWRAQFSYRETSRIINDRSEDFTTNKRFGWLLTIQLKGLTSFGAGTDQVLSESIYGYSRRTYHDY